VNLFIIRYFHEFVSHEIKSQDLRALNYRQITSPHIVNSGLNNYANITVRCCILLSVEEGTRREMYM